MYLFQVNERMNERMKWMKEWMRAQVEGGGYSAVLTYFHPAPGEWQTQMNTVQWLNESCNPGTIGVLRGVHTRSFFFYSFHLTQRTEEKISVLTQAMLVQWSSQLRLCILTGGLNTSPNTMAASAVRLSVRCWFSSMSIRQKSVVRPASVEKTTVHMGGKSPSSCRTDCFRPVCTQLYWQQQVNIKREKIPIKRKWMQPPNSITDFLQYVALFFVFTH